MEILIKIGGVFHLICSLSHIIFPKVFKWNDNLNELSPDKKKLIKNTLLLMNVCILMFWLMLSWVPFFYSHEMLSTGIGRAVLTSIIIFWVVRIFILQPLYAGFKTKSSLARTAFFIIGFILFLIPWLNLFFNFVR